MDVKKILYATDLKTSALSSTLIKNIVPLREVGLKEIIAVQVVSVDGWTKDLSECGITSKVLVEDRLRASTILRVAKKEAASAIIVNLDRKTREPVHSSLIKNLIKSSPVPVLIINSDRYASTSPKRNLFEHVIIAMDWSVASDKALNYFFTFEKQAKELEIVNVINGKLTIKDMRELKEKLSETRKLCLTRGIDAESHIYAGKTAEEIVLAAKDYKASLIVLGRNEKRSILKHVFEPSTSHKIAGAAHVPVLVVP